MSWYCRFLPRPRALAAVSVLVALAASGAASAQTYRWVDEKGRVQYSDQPPPGKLKEQRTLKPPPPGLGDAAPEDKGTASRPRTLAEEEAAFRRRAAERDKSRKEEEDRVADSKAGAQGCERAKRELGLLESGVRIQRMDAKGEIQYMEDEERAREMARLRSITGTCR